MVERRLVPGDRRLRLPLVLPLRRLGVRRAEPDRSLATGRRPRRDRRRSRSRLRDRARLALTGAVASCCEPETAPLNR